MQHCSSSMNTNNICNSMNSNFSSGSISSINISITSDHLHEHDHHPNLFHYNQWRVMLATEID